MERSFTSRLLKDSAFTAAGATVGNLFHVVSIMLATRYVSKEELGLYLLVLAVAHFASIFGGFGLDVTLVQRVSGRRDGADLSSVPTICVMRALSLALAGAALYLAALLWPAAWGGLLSALRGIVALCLLGGMRDLLYCFMQGLRRFKSYAGAQIGSAVAKCAMISALALRGRLDFDSLVSVEIISSALALVALCMAAPWRAVLAAKPEKGALRSILRFSVPVYANNILTVTHDRIAVLMIAALLNPVSVAYFEVAEKIPDAFFRLFRSFITVYFPGLSSLLAQGDTAGATKLVNSSVMLMSVAIMGIVLLIFLFRRECMTLFFSARYVETAEACALLMVCFYLRAVGNIMGYSLVSAGFPGEPTKVNSISCAVNIAGLMALIPRFGYMGAVYSLLIMNAMSVAMYYIRLPKAALAIELWKCLVPGLAAAFLGLAQASLNADSPGVRVAFFAAYAILCWQLMPDLRSLSMKAMKAWRPAPAEVETR